MSNSSLNKKEVIKKLKNEIVALEVERSDSTDDNYYNALDIVITNKKIAIQEIKKL